MVSKGRPRTQPEFCTVENCDRAGYAKSYCKKHYLRWYRHGDPGEAETRRRQGCTVEGCEGDHDSKGYCTKHYRRFLKHGDPTVVAIGPERKPRGKSPFVHGNRKFPLGVPCSVEGCDRVVRSSGLCQGHYGRLRATGSVGPAEFRTHGLGRHTTADGYVVLKWGPHGDQRRTEHRAVMEETIGRELLPEENVHHLNGVRSDNRPENLELWVTPQPSGQRVADLVAWVVAAYPEEVRTQLEAAGGVDVG